MDKRCASVGCPNKGTHSQIMGVNDVVWMCLRCVMEMGLARRENRFMKKWWETEGV